MSTEAKITISIATKDRPEVLEETLRRVHASGLGDCPLIVCDDGSEPPLAPATLELFPRGRLLRNERAHGQALARNRIARQCGTPYLLQLDDDSYPVAGDLARACEEMKKNPDCLALAFAFEEPRRDRHFSDQPAHGQIIPVRSFVGCAALLNVEVFRRLGGYAGDWIGWAGEEDELAIRAMAAGKRIFFMMRSGFATR